MSETTLATTTVLVSRVEPTADIDTIGNAWLALCWLKEQTRLIDAEWKRRMLERVQANGEVTIGDIRWYVAEPKETKCIDLRGAIEWSLGESIDTLQQCLSVNAFKPGETRKLMPPELFAKLFETVSKAKIEAGKPKKELIEVNERFVK